MKKNSLTSRVKASLVPCPWSLAPETLWLRVLLAALSILTLSVFTTLSGDLVNEDNDVLLYLALVTLSALYLGPAPSKLAALLALLALHQGRFHPGYRIGEQGSQYLLSAGIFWLIASRVASLSQSARTEHWLAQIREAEAWLLTKFSEETNAASTQEELQAAWERTTVRHTLFPELQEQLRRLMESAQQRQQARQEASQKSIELATQSVAARLLHSISHDIQTPLASILGTVEVLKQSQTQLGEKERGELLELASDQAERIRLLVKNLINSSKFDAGRVVLDCRSFQVDELIHESFKVFAPAQRARLRILARTNSLMYGDFLMLSQVLANLVDNALKYSPASSPVELVDWPGGLAVKDRANTIPHAEHELIFERFYRMPAQQRLPGSGLGLSLCAAILREHGGSIGVEACPEGGNMFYFKLPEATDASNSNCG